MLPFLSNPLVLGVLIGVVGVLGGRWAFRKDTEVEKRRKSAGRLAGTLRSKGLKHIPEFLEDYSVGDYSGMAEKIHEAAVLMDDPTAAAKAFDDLADKIIAARAPAA